jgi:hypothetical protein
VYCGVFVCFGFEFGDHFIFPKPKQKGMVPLSLTFNPDQGQNWFICFRFSFFSHPKMASWLSGLIVAAKALHTLGSIPFVS